MDKYFIILDGSNIAFYKRAHNKKAKYSNLKLAIEFMKKLKERYPIKWEIIVDASLRYRIDEEDQLNQSFKSGIIQQCADKVKADEFILSFFKRHPEKTLIISNDNFKEYNISDLILFKFGIVFEDFITVPDIEEFLRNSSNSKEKVRVDT